MTASHVFPADTAAVRSFKDVNTLGKYIALATRIPIASTCCIRVHEGLKLAIYKEVIFTPTPPSSSRSPVQVALTFYLAYYIYYDNAGRAAASVYL